MSLVTKRKQTPELDLGEQIGSVIVVSQEFTDKVDWIGGQSDDIKFALTDDLWRFFLRPSKKQPDHYECIWHYDFKKWDCMAQMLSDKTGFSKEYIWDAIKEKLGPHFPYQQTDLLNDLQGIFQKI